MRVLQILHTRERGGILTLAAMIETGLAERGCIVETEFLFAAPGRGAVGKMTDAARMAVRLMRGDHDALVAYQATASILVGVFGWMTGCPVRIVHQTAIPSVTAGILRLADKIAGSVGLYTANVVNTRFTLNEFTSYPASYRARLVLNEHGIEPPQPTQDRQAARAQFGIPPTSDVALNVGRLVAQKNQSVIVKALAKIPDVVFVVAGHGDDAKALMALAKAEGVAGRVYLPGALGAADIANLYAASDVFVFPSVWETFGLAAAEAAISGIPVIASDIAVLREVLASDRSPVVFVDKDDSAAWAEAMARAISDPVSHERLEAFSRQLAARYSVKAMIDKYLELLGGTPVKNKHDA